MLFARPRRRDYKLEPRLWKRPVPSLFPRFFHAHVEHDDLIPIHNATLYPTTRAGRRRDCGAEVRRTFIATMLPSWRTWSENDRYELTELKTAAVCGVSSSTRDINFSKFCGQAARL
jgi:hypothetical protein